MRSGSRASAFLVAALLAASLDGCIALPVARGCPGSDAIAPKLVPGVPRAVIEELAGAPIRERHGDGGVVFRLYEYQHPGAREGSLSLACMVAVGDVMTAFILELVVLVKPQMDNWCANRPVARRVYVSYDAAEVSLSTFDEFAVLPPDGRAPASPGPAGAGAPGR